jgi:hypothetical protein
LITHEDSTSSAFWDGEKEVPEKTVTYSKLVRRTGRASSCGAKRYAKGILMPPREMDRPMRRHVACQ